LRRRAGICALRSRDTWRGDIKDEFHTEWSHKLCLQRPSVCAEKFAIPQVAEIGCKRPIFQVLHSSMLHQVMSLPL
jgi:hypothetical protein